jgi:hypothetical protein
LDTESSALFSELAFVTQRTHVVREFDVIPLCHVPKNHPRDAIDAQATHRVQDAELALPRMRAERAIYDRHLQH